MTAKTLQIQLFQTIIDLDFIAAGEQYYVVCARHNNIIL